MIGQVYEFAQLSNAAGKKSYTYISILPSRSRRSCDKRVTESLEELHRASKAPRANSLQSRVCSQLILMYTAVHSIDNTAKSARAAFLSPYSREARIKGVPHSATFPKLMQAKAEFSAQSVVHQPSRSLVGQIDKRLKVRRT